MLDSFRQHTLSAAQAAEQLGLSPSRLYALASAYNTARARPQAPPWMPGTSGGDHAPSWPPPVLALLKKRLACSPPCPYSFVASEASRLHSFQLDRAQVRRWALENNLAHAIPPKKVQAPVRRWQCANIGELWQLDASPHRWFPHSQHSFPMLNLLDDCSRLFTGSQIYERKLLLSYFDFLPAAFLAHGRPLRLYVDYHSLFFTHDPAALTQLGWALKFYDISLRYAPTPQAKGKIERAHQYWQGCLPAYFASEKITEMAVANRHIDDLRAHRNTQKIHSELRQTPHRAWEQARKEKRSVLRPAPRCAWWDYVWSVRTLIKIGTDGRVRGLDTGADDYLIKPFDNAELFARLRAIIRRRAGQPRATIEIGDVCIDTAARTVTRAGEPVVLTAHQYLVLEYLALHRGEVITRTALYEHLFDENESTLSNILDVHVFNLRKKLGQEFIVTRRGHGYCIE